MTCLLCDCHLSPQTLHVVDPLISIDVSQHLGILLTQLIHLSLCHCFLLDKHSMLLPEIEVQFLVLSCLLERVVQSDRDQYPVLACFQILKYSLEHFLLERISGCFRP